MIIRKYYWKTITTTHITLEINIDDLLINYHRVVASKLNINYLTIKVFNKQSAKLKELDRQKIKKELKSILIKKAYYSMEEFMEDTFKSR